MISGFEGWPAYGRAAAPAVWDELTSQFGWLVTQFADRSDIEAFAARLLHIPLPAHTPLITRDASSCSLYLVARGALSVTVAHADRSEPAGRRALVAGAGALLRSRAHGHSERDATASPDTGTVTLGHIGEGGWIGENGLLNLEPMDYSVTVARDSWLLVLTASQFARLRQERLSAASTLLRIFSLQIADRFRACRRRMAEQAGAAARPQRGSSLNASLALLAVLLGITKA